MTRLSFEERMGRPRSGRRVAGRPPGVLKGADSSAAGMFRCKLSRILEPGATNWVTLAKGPCGALLFERELAAHLHDVHGIDCPLAAPGAFEAAADVPDDGVLYHGPYRPRRGAIGRYSRRTP